MDVVETLHYCVDVVITFVPAVTAYGDLLLQLKHLTQYREVIIAGRDSMANGTRSV